ncbi:hypothetical protein A2348_03105 [Candidatus Uhrbacteria bacterium RIFOXYB12_FULL_58_10]|uniref:Uncharacterized protein n=1 Tax=Candidatus Uhrbacteria bacterium RIFOXYB2_FULL_57_15 TaxID=1802422 RepID=A0A1F7W5B3_9BACT|nr:MAG: hypothetical protein A2348_03105 [Candidatus Uhrbacteria bacterium RIFOXYB12_FULL_58_10]OGL97949.1 MAG: hypothetical protein A2304_05345 [Candidatus Uhrbacteria bacterium RIFOXYB2_FULL_57_15]
MTHAAAATTTAATNTAATPVADLSMIPALPGQVNAPLMLDFARPFVPQVQTYFEGLGNDARGNSRVALVGQGVAAILCLPALEMLGGLPVVIFKGFATDAPLVEVDLKEFRHVIARDRRKERSNGEAFAGFTVIDGSGRGLSRPDPENPEDRTPDQLGELAAQLGCGVDEIRVLSCQAGNRGQVDLTSAEGAIAGMVDQLVGLGLTAEDWTSGRVIFLPGGMGIVAALQAVAIHGLSEAWPWVIRLAADAEKAFHVAEVVDAQAMRQWAVALSAQLDAAAPIATLSGEIPDEFRNALAALAARYGVEIRG